MLCSPRPASPRTTRHRLACSGAVTLAFGALLLPAAATASAQTVRPSAPAPATRPVRSEPVELVQVAAPVAYQPPAPHEGPAVAVHAAPSAAAAPAPAPAPPPPPAPGFCFPAPGAPVSNPYGAENAEYVAGYHTGVDFAVDSGTPLRAVGAGTVVSAGWAGAYGQEVVLELPDGRFAEYAHLSELAVTPGQEVDPCQELGRSGSTGNATGPHLHFEIRSANHYGAVLDPVAYLTEHGARP
ncbi:M23 family metallopeptidase [Kitasatospora sp. NPDC002227]|uniref:M23 family metallopeptidase n=1 Tax=Kitasatospora sp. NPDC002227 TaxID=3154773 RepID=UPI00333332E1